MYMLTLCSHCLLLLTRPWNWLVHTNSGLLTRILIGSGIFTMLAAADFRRHGRSATRWREYAVLLAAVAAALVYGAVNDQVTVTISPEYFIFGKEIYKTIGEHPPMRQLRWEAAKVGLKATWTVGLIFGVLLLIANNPYGPLPRLPNRQLLWYLPVILLTALTCGAMGGWLGYHGYLTPLDSDFRDMVYANVYRPRRFMCTWGVHLGGYVGGIVGTIGAVIAVVVTRRRRVLGRHCDAD
jgi:hypothetical protein